MKPNLEALEDRELLSSAIFSNGVLTVFGDARGNQINVSALAGNVQVTERGLPVPVLAVAGVAPTIANTGLVVELAGPGRNNTLKTDASLGAIPDSLVGNGTGQEVFLPGNNATSFATGSPTGLASDFFQSNPGGKDVFVGGAGVNNFFWPPGTGTNSYIGRGRFNSVIVTGNNGGAAEQDTLLPDGLGGVTYSRNNLVPFQLYTQGIQDWVLNPSTGPGNQLIIGDMTGTPTQQIVVNTPGGQANVDASRQLSRNVALFDFAGAGSRLETGAGLNLLGTTGPSNDTVTLTRANDVLVYGDPTVVVVPATGG